VDDAEGEIAGTVTAGAPARLVAVRRDLSPVTAAAIAPGRWVRFFDSDFWHSFRSSPVAMVSAAVALACIFCAVFAGWIAPHNPTDLATLELGDSMLPPAWMAGGMSKYLLGTDEQGRDVLSALMYGAQISLFVGAASVLLSLLIGVTLGLVSGYAGGRVDALIMRICDVMLSFPSILIALLIAGVGHALFPDARDTLAFGVLIIAIALPGWVQYARAVRGSTMVERQKEYVQAARVIGVSPLRIMRKHVLGVGVSPTSPSLGTFINEGQKQLFSGAWWLVIFPGLMLVLIVLSINLFGDWLRDALNPRLR
jgi:peptide/nickel transport system permease protein